MGALLEWAVQDGTDKANADSDRGVCHPIGECGCGLGGDGGLSAAGLGLRVIAEPWACDGTHGLFDGGADATGPRQRAPGRGAAPAGEPGSPDRRGDAGLFLQPHVGRAAGGRGDPDGGHRPLQIGERYLRASRGRRGDPQNRAGAAGQLPPAGHGLPLRGGGIRALPRWGRAGWRAA